MAKIDRFNGNVQSFASQAQGTERTIFGDTDQSNTLDGNITADFLRGWGIVGVNENPTKQDFNGLAFTLGQLISYLHQRGIPEWNTSQEFYEGSVVTTLNGIYRLKAGGTATVNPDTDAGVNWELAPTRAEIEDRVIQVTSVPALLAVSPVENYQYLAASFRPELNVGGGVFVWDSTALKTTHNGGTVIDSDKTFPTDWSGETDTAAWFTPAASGTGCFVRVGGNSEATLVNFGADPTGSENSDAALDGAFNGTTDFTPVGGSRYKSALYLGTGSFLFERGHTLEGNLNNIIGEGDRSTVLRYEGTDTVFLNITGQFMFFSGFIAIGATTGKTFVKNFNTNGTADCDIYFSKVHGNSFRYMHHCVGRGSSNVDCTVSGGGVTTWSFVESPEPFTAGSNPTIQTLETGMRRYTSLNLQVDNARAVFEFSTDGPAAEFINEVTIHGTHGNQLFRIIDGGYINYASIKTGQLVASLIGGIVKAARLRDADIEVNSTTLYDRTAPATSDNTANTVIDVQTVDAVETTDTLIENLNVSGVFGGMSNRFILTNGYVNNINIDKLSLPRSYDHISSSAPVFISGKGGGGVNIDNVTFDCADYSASTFKWSTLISDVNVGNYIANDVPILPVMKNFGTAVLLSGTTNIAVLHGMGRTPLAGSILITQSSAAFEANPFWARDPTATNFIISSTSAPSSNVSFNWRIDMGVS